jgi:hypothetical protein
LTLFFVTVTKYANTAIQAINEMDPNDSENNAGNVAACGAFTEIFTKFKEEYCKFEDLVTLTPRLRFAFHSFFAYILGYLETCTYLIEGTSIQRGRGHIQYVCVDSTLPGVVEIIKIITALMESTRLPEEKIGFPGVDISLSSCECKICSKHYNGIELLELNDQAKYAISFANTVESLKTILNLKIERPAEAIVVKCTQCGKLICRTCFDDIKLTGMLIKGRKCPECKSDKFNRHFVSEDLRILLFSKEFRKYVKCD